MAFINRSEKKMRILLTPFIICLLLLSCSSGKKAFERGDYFNATLQAVNRLRSNPNSEKALQAVKDSYPMSITYFQGKIDFALSTNSCLLYTSPSPRDGLLSRMPSSA